MAANHRFAIEALYPVMLRALETKSFGRARNICEQVILWEPQNPVHHYNLACIEAQAGRLPYAWSSLQLAIALGFNDVMHLQSDPDLAPLRDDPRFAEIVRKMLSPPSLPTAPGSPEVGDTPAPLPASESAPKTEDSNTPVGLYLMSKYLPASHSLERSVWFFGPDRQVYRGLESGCSRADLASHAGPRGIVTKTAPIFEITWSNGTSSAGKLERDGAGFMWDMGIFAAVKPFENPAAVAGAYESQSPALLHGCEVPLTHVLQLRGDGTFLWEGVAFQRSPENLIQVSAALDVSTSGRWELNDFSLTLTSDEGLILRRIAFPDDDEKTVIRPDRMYFGGLVYKRQP